MARPHGVVTNLQRRYARLGAPSTVDETVGRGASFMPHDRKKPLRWRKVVFRVFYKREFRHELRRGDEVFAHVRKSSHGWYWTSTDSLTPTYSGTEAQCKEAAQAFVASSEQAKEGR